MIKSKSLELILIKTPEYLQEKSCIGCSYFSQVKGHFGQCIAALDKKNNPTNKYYDGTKKGSACSLYRTTIELPKNVEVKTLEEFREDRLKYNEETKAKRKIVRALKAKGNPYYVEHGLNENREENIRGFKNPNFTKHYKDLPFQLTSDLGSIKKGYYGHHHNHHVINYALKLIKLNRPTKEIKKQIHDYYKIRVDVSTICDWRFRFLKINDPKGKFAKSRFNQTVIETLPYLFKQGLSCREISRVLLKEQKIKISHVTICNWLLKDNPHIKFSSNASHKPEIKLKISQGVTKYWQTHDQKGKGKGVSKKLKWMLDLQKKYENVDNISLAKRILQQEIDKIKPTMVLCQ